MEETKRIFEVEREIKTKEKKKFNFVKEDDEWKVEIPQNWDDTVPKLTVQDTLDILGMFSEVSEFAFEELVHNVAEILAEKDNELMSRSLLSFVRKFMEKSEGDGQKLEKERKERREQSYGTEDEESNGEVKTKPSSELIEQSEQESQPEGSDDVEDEIQIGRSWGAVPREERLKIIEDAVNMLNNEDNYDENGHLKKGLKKTFCKAHNIKDGTFQTVRYNKAPEWEDKKEGKRKLSDMDDEEIEEKAQNLKEFLSNSDNYTETGRLGQGKMREFAKRNDVKYHAAYNLKSHIDDWDGIEKAKLEAQGRKKKHYKAPRWKEEEDEKLAEFFFNPDNRDGEGNLKDSAIKEICQKLGRSKSAVMTRAKYIKGWSYEGGSSFPDLNTAGASKEHLKTVFKDMVNNNGRIDPEDSFTAVGIDEDDFDGWNKFLNEFMMKQQKICNYLGVENKFSIKKSGNTGYITYGR